jgi:hypothetical protein
MIYFYLGNPCPHLPDHSFPTLIVHTTVNSPAITHKGNLLTYAQLSSRQPDIVAVATV